MKSRFVALAFCALLSIALGNLAEEPRWYKQPGTPVTIESSGFELRTRLPQGWSFTTEQGFLPPPDLAFSCRVRGWFYTDRNWDRLLVSALEPTTWSYDARMVMKIGGHPAVSNRYVREGRTIRDTYINLSDLQPDSGTIWTFEGSLTPEGSECELQFLAMIHSAKIARR